MNEAYFYLFNEVTTIIDRIQEDADFWFQSHGKRLRDDPERDLLFALEATASRLRRAQQEAEEIVIADHPPLVLEDIDLADPQESPQPKESSR